jgi:hypothetical protein
MVNSEATGATQSHTQKKGPEKKKSTILLMANLVDPSPKVSSHVEFSLTMLWLAENGVYTKVSKCPNEAQNKE